jgi:hypothetical protein
MVAVYDELTGGIGVGGATGAPIDGRPG